MKGFIIGTIATAVVFAIVAYVLPQIDFTGDWTQLALLALIAGLVNGLIKPVIKLLTFPISVITLGLFGLIVNAFLLLLIAWLAERVDIDFTVGGFAASPISVDAIAAAIIGAIAISVTGTLVGMVIRD